ncbi:MAG: F0F1 ATP synthase subunit A [Clostridiales bacterium]|nr:F0F1 ATP synthase subunit A [Clostridiales bacterium]MBS6559134.1 F0F1 ATP synthase subunit A [Clostridiales bacterium]
MEQIECRKVSIAGFQISEAVVVTWIIMAAVVLLSIILVRNLKVENPGKKQLALESAIGALHNIFADTLGEEGKQYVQYLMTVIIYIGFSNIIGLFGFKPPTKDLNVTAAMAIMSIVLIEYSGIHQKGLKGWLKSFASPSLIILPINIMEIFIKPVSLCMRLFGNVLGAFVIMEMLKAVIPAIIPIPFSFYFDIFDGLLQAYIFTLLTALFIKEQIE